MKNIFAIFILSFCLTLLSITVQGQIWNTKIPYESADALSPVKQLIKTNDNGFLVLIWKFIQQNSKSLILKYDVNGQLIWEKEIDFGYNNPDSIGGVFPYNIFQLPNDNIVTTGTYGGNNTNFCFLMTLNNLGDSISNTDISATCETNLSFIDPSFYIFYYKVDTDEKIVAQLDASGNFINEIVLGSVEGFNSIIDSEINTYVIRNAFDDTFNKFSSTGDLLATEVYEDVGQFLVFSQQGNLTAYEDALIQLNDDLSQKWKTEAEDLLFVPNNTSLKQRATAFLPTSDNGFILAGRFGDLFSPLILQQIYLIKVDELGQWEWGYVYSSFDMPFNHIADIVEVSDGYVFVGTSGATEEIWLVKINKNGTTSVEDINKQEFPKVRIFPNPVDEILNISFDKKFSGQLRLTNIQGQILFEEKSLQKKHHSILLTHYPNGVYILSLTDEDFGFFYSYKIIKQ